MLRSSSNLGFPRKVVVYYLLFCLIAVSSLAMGMLFAFHSVMDSRTTSACLARLGKRAATLELEYLRNGPGNLQDLLQNCQWSAGLLNCSIVSLEGTVLAHSDANLVGQGVNERKGSQLRWGNVSGLQYQDVHGQAISEYRVPLIAHEDHFGSLRIAVQHLNFWSTLAEIARLAPAAILLPLGLIAGGALFLGRLVSSLAKVDAQLRGIALERPTVDIRPAKDAISIGWNRVANTLQRDSSAGRADDLQARIAEVVSTRGEGELQEALHHLSDGIAVTDIEGRITFANRAVTALLGTEETSEGLTGIELEKHLLKAFSSSNRSPIFENTADSCPTITEIERQGGGDQRALRVARLPLESGSLRGHVWSVRDVTRQKLTEKTRDQFIDAATHELRTPLSNIKAYAEILVTSDAIEVEQQKEFCNIINSEVTRLARFVDDLLSISSMEAGSITLNRHHTIPARLFEEVLTKVQPLMKQKNIEFVVQVPEKMTDVQLDKDKIVAVVVNLLGNAVKYTPAKGRISLRVKLDEAQLQIAVEDTGVGISTDEMPKVFEKFFRSSDPRVQAEVGTGLGLSLAREVIRMHGGDITVESQIDRGTTFTATLPVR